MRKMTLRFFAREPSPESRPFVCVTCTVAFVVLLAAAPAVVLAAAVEELLLPLLLVLLPVPAVVLLLDADLVLVLLLQPAAINMPAVNATRGARRAEWRVVRMVNVLPV